MHSNGAAECTKNTFKCTVNLPTIWVKDMGITSEDRKVVLSFYPNNKIKIKKYNEDELKENEVSILLQVRKTSINRRAWSVRLRWSWINEMNITKEDNLLIVSYNDDKEISIQKA